MKKLMGVLVLVAFAVAFVTGFGIPQATASPLAGCVFVQQSATINSPQDVAAAIGLEMEAVTFETQGYISPTTGNALEGSWEGQLNSGSNQRAWLRQVVSGAVSKSIMHAELISAGEVFIQRVWPISVVFDNNQWAPCEVGSLSGSSDCAAATSIYAEYAVRTAIRMPEVVQTIVV